MWELVHMPDVSLESDVARVRDPLPALFGGGLYVLLRKVFHPSVGPQFFPKQGVDGEALVRRVVRFDQWPRVGFFFRGPRSPGLASAF